MNKEYLIGIICGIIVGVVFIGIAMKKTRTDRSMKCKFDERQRLVRATGFKYSFFTLMIYDLAYGIINNVFEKRWAEDLAAMFLGVCLALLVYAGYTIWNEGYFSLNDNPRKVLILFVLLAVLNLIGAARMISGGYIIEDGVLTSDSINLICGLMFIIICFMVLIKWQVSKKEAD